MRFDVLIAGGGLAGSALALDLRRRGIDAVALERGRLAKPKVCGAVLSPGALGCLDELGLLEEVRSGPVQELSRVVLRWGRYESAFRLPLPALVCSRERLDALLAGRAGVLGEHTVGRIDREGSRFRVEVHTHEGARSEFGCRIVVDASGRGSRLSAAGGSGRDFGVSFQESRDPGDVLEFGFFPWGYGGTVGLGDGTSNSAFLVTRAALPRFLARPGCRVTGPIAYDRPVSPWIAIGDAAGMIDPFSGEGMHQALASARVAADAIARGLSAGWRYETIRETARGEGARGTFPWPTWVRTLARAPGVSGPLAATGLPALLLESCWRGGRRTVARFPMVKGRQ